MNASRGTRFLDMRWFDVCFAHFRLDASSVARTLPRGVEVDLFEGSAWLSVVPFHMRDVRATFMPVLPGFARVPELNLRTYVRVGGVPGVWFYSLDAASPALVSAARATTGLPYFDAAMYHAESGDETIAYASRRRAQRGAPAGEFAAAYRPMGDERVAAPGSLEAFLVERYRFFGTYFGRTIRCEIAHEPWRLRDVRIEIGTNSLGAVAGIELPARPDAAAFSRGMRVRAGAIRFAMPAER